MHFPVYFLSISILFCSVISNAQDLKSLYESDDYEKAITFADKADELSGEDLFYLGKSHYKLDLDKEAISYYDLAIKKGFDNAEVYYFKGLSQRWIEEYEAAIRSYNIAISKDAGQQTYFSEKAYAFLQLEQLDSAYQNAMHATRLPYKNGMAYYLVGEAERLQQKYDQALIDYYVALSTVAENDYYFLRSLYRIGILEYAHTQNYPKAIQAYKRLIDLDSTQYDIYTELIQSYYANGQYSEGEAYFEQLRSAFKREELPEDMMKTASVIIAQFTWNDQEVLVWKRFREPTETLDIMYKVILLNKAGDEIERVLMTERTIKFRDDGPLHLLCEREKNGTHHTYAYGWKDDNIEFESLKAAAIAIFEKELTPSASSTFNVNTKSSDKQKKKKKKK